MPQEEGVVSKWNLDQEVSLDTLTSESDPSALVYAFGACVRTATTSLSKMRTYVEWLRSRQIRILPDDMPAIKSIITTAYGSNTELVDAYARILRSLLTCDVLPASFSVTNAVAVPCYNCGDAVDGQFVVNNQRVWFAGVVVGKRDPHQPFAYLVFWLGHEPKTTGKDRNPQWMSVHVLRAHVEDSVSGPKPDWLNIDTIREMYEPEKAQGESCPEELNERDTSGDKPSGSPQNVTADVDKNVEADASHKHDSGARQTAQGITNPIPALNPIPPICPVKANLAKKEKRESKQAHREKRASPKATSFKPPTAKGKSRRKKKETKSPKPGHPKPGHHPSKGKGSGFRVSAVASQKSFEIGDSVKFAIDCLESLDKGTP